MDKSFLFDYGRKLYSKYSFNIKTGEIKMPMRYVLELTYNCNLRCPFCYITEERPKNELSAEEWIKIIDQIPPFSVVTFCAGEVLLKKDFDIIFKKASEKFRKVTLISNGILLNEKNIDLLIKHKLFLLSVSFDGYKENHDKNRNCKGLWNIVHNNLEQFNEERKYKNSPMLDIKTCVLNENLEDLPLLYKEAIKLNAQFFSLTFLRKQCLRQNSKLSDEFTTEFYQTEYPIEPYFDINKFKEIYKELESISKTTKTTLRYAPRFNPRNDGDNIERYFNAKNTDITELYHPCKIPMTTIFITQEGFVYPCLSYKVADLKEMSIKEAINTPKFKCFRKNLYYSKLFTACQTCCDAIPKNLSNLKFPYNQN